MVKNLDVISHMSQLLKLSQRQRSFLGFAQKAFNNTSVMNKMDKGKK